MFLRRVARPLMMMARVKETTGIVGLDVVPNAREVLIGLYTRTLDEIKKVPEDEGYRKAVESFTRHRLTVCKEEEDWEAIEKKLGCKQVEVLIEEAQDELKLMAHMLELDAWDTQDDFYKTLKAVETGTLELAISASEKVDTAVKSDNP